MSRAVADDLRAVRERLVTQGWTQGAMQNAIGQVCLVGAGSCLSSNAWLATRVALYRAMEPDRGELSQWNDAPGRTFAEVLALLDKAIAAEEARS